MAEKQLRAKGHCQKETQQLYETAEKELKTRESGWIEKYKVGIHPERPKTA